MTTTRLPSTVPGFSATTFRDGLTVCKTDTVASTSPLAIRSSSSRPVSRAMPTAGMAEGFVMEPRKRPLSLLKIRAATAPAWATRSTFS